jgi:hypothetical protein
MSDDSTQDGQAEASAPAPAQPPDTEAIKAELRSELTAEFDTRVAGFQTVINQKDEEIRQLKTASLSEEEREQLAESEKDRRIADLEEQVALAKVAKENPQIGEVFQQLAKAESYEEQAAILLKLATPAPPPEPEPAAPSDVDMNNPNPTVGEIAGRMPDGTPITGESAWEALKRLGPTPLGIR